MRTTLTGALLLLTYLLAREVFDNLPTGAYLLVMLAIFAPLLAIGAWVNAGERRNNYAARRRRTLAQLGMSAAGILKPHQLNSAVSDLVLFLRPFVSDTIEAANPHEKRSSNPFVQFITPSALSIDDVLQSGLPNEAHFVALSRDVRQLGAAKVATSDNDWQDVVLQLMKSARLIIMVPGDKASTKWELTQLRTQGYLSKCVFLVVPPPAILSASSELRDAVSLVAVQRALQEAGYFIEPTQGQGLSDGAALLFDADARLTACQPGVVRKGALSIEFDLQRLQPLLATAWPAAGTVRELDPSGGSGARKVHGFWFWSIFGIAMSIVVSSSRHPLQYILGSLLAYALARAWPVFLVLAAVGLIAKLFDV